MEIPSVADRGNGIILVDTLVWTLGEELLEAVGNDSVQQALLGAEVVVEGRGLNFCALADRACRDLSPTGGVEQVGCGDQQSVAGACLVDAEVECTRGHGLTIAPPGTSLS